MNINVQNNGIGKKRIIIIISIIVICIVAIFIAVYVQWFKEKSIEELRQESEQKENSLGEKELLEKNFDEIFSNDLKNAENLIIEKNKGNKEIVYSKYKGTVERENEYSVTVNIPYINIKSDIIIKYNEEIENIFVEKLKKILSEKTNEIYTVEYTANVNENILSIIIKSTLKQAGGAQRIIVKTFCYDIENQKELNLQEILDKNSFDKNEIQNKIIQKIKEEQSEALALEQLGYVIYKRDFTDEIYKIENITDFYIDENNNIYIIFAYGNNKNTGEIDIIVI